MYNIPVLFVSILLFFLSCKDSESEQYNKAPVKVVKTYKGPKVKIFSKSGELFENAPYLPLPLNHGKISNKLKDTLDVLILGLPIEDADTYVIPIAYFELLENGIIRQFILAYPEDERYQSMKIESYDVFMRQNYPIKNIIDTWFANYKGLASIRVANWKDNFFAEELLLRDKYWKK